MLEKQKIIVITHLYLFPNAFLKRGGLIIHDSLVNMKRANKNVEVVFYLPFIWSYLKYFRFDLKKFTFVPYKIEGIIIHPIFYIPRLSKSMLKLDIYLKILAFRVFYKRHFFKDMNNVEVIYGQTLYPDGPLLPKIAKSLKAPYIVNLRGSDVHTFSAKNSKIYEQSLGVLKSSNLVMSVSEKLRSIAIDVFGKDYVSHILYTICQTDVFKNTQPVSDSLNKIIYIGALVKAKGIYELIEAFSILSKEKQYELVLVGNGGDRKEFDRLIAKEGLSDFVNFKGEISNRQQLANEINDTDIMVFASHNEGLPNAVVEGVACERLVICSNVGGVKEICNENMAYQIIPPMNVEAIVSAVENLDTITINELRNYASNNRKHVLKRFGPDSQLDSFQSVFKKLK